MLVYQLQHPEAHAKPGLNGWLSNTWKKVKPKPIKKIKITLKTPGVIKDVKKAIPSVSLNNRKLVIQKPGFVKSIQSITIQKPGFVKDLQSVKVGTPGFVTAFTGQSNMAPIPTGTDPIPADDMPDMSDPALDLPDELGTGVAPGEIISPEYELADQLIPSVQDDTEENKKMALPQGLNSTKLLLIAGALGLAFYLYKRG